MIYTIPLQPVANQQLSCPIAGFSCTFWVRQLSTGLYMDIWLDNTPLIMGTICLNKVDIIRNPASPLSGMLYFTDTQGNADPAPTGLGSRFPLRYESNTR